MVTPSLSPDKGFDPNGNTSSKRRIVTDIQSQHEESKRNMIHVRSLDTLGEIPSDH